MYKTLNKEKLRLCEITFTNNKKLQIEMNLEGHDNVSHPSIYTCGPKYPDFSYWTLT